MKHQVIVIGAGGHGSVVADALLACGIEVIGFTDSNRHRHDDRLCGLPILGDDDQALSCYASAEILLANGIGGVRTTDLRHMVQMRLQGKGWRFATVRHPSAIVSPRTTIAEDAQLLAGSIVQVGAEIGTGSIINTSAVIEHDCSVGSFVHVAPGALLCGNVTIGDHSHIGAGAIVKQSVRLGPNTIVGAGAVVLENFSGCVLTGIPARPAEPAP